MTKLVLPLQEWRARRLLTQDELTERTDNTIRRATISAIECGATTRPHPSTIRRISEALKLHPSQITEFRRRLGPNCDQGETSE